MRLITQIEANYFPDPEQDTVLHLGLRSLDPNQWMQRDADYAQFLLHKNQVFADYPDKVYFALPESQSVQAEFHQVLVQHLAADHGLSSLSDQPFTSLWDSSLLVQEDICLLQPKAKDSYRLTAASVCSPSNWKLEEKVDADVDKIHAPVPDYDAVLSARVNRLFCKLKVEAPLLRYNWSVQNGNELFWRSDLQAQDPAIEPHWYWRVERQTLVRLPKTQAIVFAIRVYLHDLAALSRRSNFKPRLQAIVRRLPAEQRQYKGLQRWLQGQ